jgi:hypothetical protein
VATLPVAAVASAAVYVAVVVGHEAVTGRATRAPWVDVLSWALPLTVYAGAAWRVVERCRRSTRQGADGIVPGVAAVFVSVASIWVFFAAEFVLAQLAMALTDTFPRDAPL